MEFSELLLKRESCRAYDSSKNVAREDVLKIVEAGRLAPSGCNAQPWKFIVVDSPEAKAKLCDALVVGGEKKLTGAPWREQVPVFIIITELEAVLKPFALEYYQDSQRFAQGDIGMTVLNMCYAAADLGISSCVIGMNDQKKMEEYFSIPEGHTVRLVLALGYTATPDAAPRQKIRKPLEEVCSFNQW